MRVYQQNRNGSGGKSPYQGEYLIQGGMAPLCVDTQEIKSMSEGLRATAIRLDGLNGFVSVEHTRLYACYQAKLQALSEAAAAGDTTATPAIARLQAAWQNFSDRATTVQHCENGIVALSEQSDEIGLLLRRATGMYELSESQVLQLMSPSLAEVGLMNLAKRLMDEVAFPSVFTINGQKYYAKNLSDAQKAAVFLSWIQAKMGEKYHGVSHSITLRSAKGRQKILTEGFEDSPELNQAFAVYLRGITKDKPTKSQELNAALMRYLYHQNRQTHKQEPKLVLPGAALTGTFGPLLVLQQANELLKSLNKGKTPHDQKITLLIAGITRMIAENQAASRQQKDADFAKTKTAKAIGINEKQRLETKTLGLDESGDLVKNADGSITRNLPRDIGDVYRYAQTVDPYDGAAFEIQQWETASGKKGVRVVLRGTDSWDAGSRQLQDMLTNTEAVAGLKTGMQRAVAAALEQAGVSAETPVELVGHSQAGIVAANLAADAGFTKRFNVKTVITAGSPVAYAKIPESIKVLNLHNNGDGIPLTEGAVNQTSTNHLTVRGNYTMSTDLAKNHDAVNTYAAMADDLQGKHYINYDNFLECRNKYMGLDEKIVKATSQRYEVNRDLEPLNSKVKQ